MNPWALRILIAGLLLASLFGAMRAQADTAESMLQRQGVIYSIRADGAPIPEWLEKGLQQLVKEGKARAEEVPGAYTIYSLPKREATATQAPPWQIQAIAMLVMFVIVWAVFSAIRAARRRLHRVAVRRHTRQMPQASYPMPQQQQRHNHGKAVRA